MNMFLTNVAMLLAGEATTTSLPGWLDTLITAMQRVINPILILCAVAGTIYAIVVGVKFVKADSKDEREEAKQKLISVIIGIVVTLVLICAFYWLAYALKNNIIRLNFWQQGNN